MRGGICIQLPQPCSEDWEKMTPAERGRHCAACQKTVVDFAAMSDNAMVRLLSGSKEPVCGRFTESQLNRPIRHQAQLPGRRISIRMAASLLGLHLLGGAAAQQAPPTLPGRSLLRSLPISSDSRTLTAFVLKNQRPLPECTVLVRPLDTMICTDKNGMFSFRVPPGIAMNTIRFEVVEHLEYENEPCVLDANLYPYLDVQATEEEDGAESFTASWQLFEVTVTAKLPPVYHSGIVHLETEKPVRKKGWQRFSDIFKKRKK